MRTMAITNFKTNALRVLSEVSQRREPIVVTKRGKPIAEIIPYSGAKRQAGALASCFVFEKDVVSPLGAEDWNACQ